MVGREGTEIAPTSCEDAKNGLSKVTEVLGRPRRNATWVGPCCCVPRPRGRDGN